MFGLGAGELLVIFVLALIFIGPKKLPELAKGLGKGIREFQRAKDDIMDDINSPPDSEDKPKIDPKTNMEINSGDQVAEVDKKQVDSITKEKDPDKTS